MQGRLPDGRAREPVGPLTPQARQQLQTILQEMGLL